MNLDNIATQVAKGESETLEFKETTGGHRRAAQTVCAFLNGHGGQVLFGVRPDGRILGQQVGDRTIEDLSSEMQHIEPPIFPEIDHIHVKKDRYVIAVQTSRGALRPYAYRGKAYRRVGNTTRVMSTEESNRILFERMHSEQRWENQSATGWSIDDLDTDEIRRTIGEAIRLGRLKEQPSHDPTDLLRGLGLLSADGVPYRAAVVLFGKEERMLSEMPQCLLRVAHFKGVDRLEFLDNRQFVGNAFALLDRAESFLRNTLPISGRFAEDSFVRIDEPRYPPLATREAIANAICHRDYATGGSSVGVAVYEDRLEVTSVGSLHFDLTPESLFLPHESRPWNPLIAHVFYMRGIIEKWGGGIHRMVKLVKEFGLSPPEIEDNMGCVTVRFRHSKATEKTKKQKSVDLQNQVFELLVNEKTGLSRREILAQINTDTNPHKLRRVLEELRSRGVIISTGRGLSARWKIKGMFFDMQ